jgi:hypothetical protein
MDELSGDWADGDSQFHIALLIGGRARLPMDRRMGMTAAR